MRGENQETLGEANLFQFWNNMKVDRKPVLWMSLE